MNNYTDYYVYAFLDPRKPGKFNYSKYKFDCEPFYIGKGRGNRLRQHFTPYDLSQNNLKSTKIKAIRNIGLEPIEIKIYDNLTEIEALNKEIELINLIGRIDLNTGILTNMTIGGDGVSGYEATEELKKQRSINAQGNKNPMYGKTHIMGTMDFNNRKVYQIDSNSNKILAEFNSISNAAKETNSRADKIQQCCNGNRTTHNKFKWEYVTDDDRIIRNWMPGGAKIPILQLSFETGEVIREWESTSDAARFFKINRQNITQALKKYKKSCCGFKWKYKDENLNIKK